MGKFAKYVWAVLAYTVLVILYGAFVRATGSGAGCGAHWPLCNGQVIPRAEQVETLIEFVHRLTSGVTLPLVIILFIWARRLYAKSSLIRVSSGASVFFTITEALVGAGLVLFGLVADNDSVARAISMVVHLVNTFLLVGALGLTALWATRGEPGRLRFANLNGLLLGIGLLGMLILGASGAVTALGDTLFPASGPLSEEIRKDFSPTAHYLLRLRVFHPGIAVGVGIYLGMVTAWIRRKYAAENNNALETVTSAFFWLYGLQIVLGVINVALFAPVWMQIIHLLVTNLIWISYILMTGLVLGNLTASVSDHALHDPVGQFPR
jgi:heme A synthase